MNKLHLIKTLVYNHPTKEIVRDLAMYLLHYNIIIRKIIQKIQIN